MPAGKPSAAIIPVERVQQKILIIRGHRVILGADLARVYGVTTKRLNQQVQRNIERFPEDFMFQLAWEEAQILRLQFATLNTRKTGSSSRLQFATLNRGKNIKYRPYVFTEHGAIMAATVLNSPQAVSASLFVVRAFVKLRELLATHHQLAAKLDELERKLQDHDEKFVNVFDAIRQIMDEQDEPPKPPIGFATEATGHKLARRPSRR